MPRAAATILVVDGDAAFAHALGARVRSAGFECAIAASGEDALDVLKTRTVELVLLDAQLDEDAELPTLQRLQDQHPDVGVIVLPGKGGPDAALAALRRGALDVLSARSCSAAELSARIGKGLEQLRAARELSFYRAELARGAGHIVHGRSRRMLEMLEIADKVASTSVTVLLSGEVGSGKQTLARYLHERSERRHGPFVAVDLGTLTPAQIGVALFGQQRTGPGGVPRLLPGKFELASGGTLLLNDITALSLELQARLLRALEERHIERLGAERPVRVDLRVLCATSEPLERAVREGRFREDLYWRLKVVPIELPPLRERRADLRELAEHFLLRHSPRESEGPRRLSDGAAAIFSAYGWPGNLRELDNEMHRIALTAKGRLVEECDVSLDIVVANVRAAGAGGDATLSTAAQAFEKGYLRRVLADHGWHKRDAAAALDIGYSTLRLKLKQHGIGSDDD